MLLRSAVTTLVALLVAVASSYQLPDGFEKQRVLTSDALLDGITMDFEWTPTGLLIVVKKEGKVLIFEDPDGDFSYSRRIVSLDLEPVLCLYNEGGLAGVEVHPDFANNRYIFLYYTYNKHGTCEENPNNGPVNRLSRFVLPPSNVIDAQTETVYFETPSLEYNHHHGGDIAIGNDLNLYVTVGDGGSLFTPVSADPGNLLGSIIRLDLEGGIPLDNPFTFESGEPYSARCNATGRPPVGSPLGTKCQEIFAMGLRNPYKFAMDPNTEDFVRFFVNDVGQNKWEEISEGGTKFAGAHYGWPLREGPCLTHTVENCADSHPYQDPFHFYEHTELQPRAACTGGTFIPEGSWPKSYDRAYLYGDYRHGLVYLMKESDASACISCNPPVSNKEVSVFMELSEVLTIKFGPFNNTQALYSTDLTGEIHRIRYAGSSNRSPVAVIHVSKEALRVGEEVQFSSQGSMDHDGDKVAFEWDFNGDGIVDSTERNASFSYNNAGLYYVSLTVKDGKGGETTTGIEISVGNRPKPVIVSPAEGTSFAVGDVFTLKGYAMDKEHDGYLPNHLLSWEIRKHHDDHYHPFLGKTDGNNIISPAAPSPEDYEAAKTSYLEILLTAKDYDGLETTVSRLILPKKVMIEFVTDPPGLEVFLDGSRFKTPGTAVTWDSNALKIEAPDQFLDGQVYLWSSWSNDGGQFQIFNVTAPMNAPHRFVATFEKGNLEENPPPTNAPTKCLPISLNFTSRGDVLRAGDTFENRDENVFISQQRDGNLVVSHGSPSNPGARIWASGAIGSSDYYKTRLYSDSYLVTYESRDNEVLWDSPGDDLVITDYFLGLDCNKELVSVYLGRPSVPGPAVYTFFPGPYLGIRAGGTMLSGQSFINYQCGVYLRQQRDGNLVVRRGTPTNVGEVMWASGGIGKETSGSYFTQLQYDSNLRTFSGTPYDRGESLWGSQVVNDPSNDYFLGVTCNESIKVAVFSGTPNNPGRSLWD